MHGIRMCSPRFSPSTLPFLSVNWHATNFQVQWYRPESYMLLTRIQLVQRGESISKLNVEYLDGKHFTSPDRIRIYAPWRPTRFESAMQFSNLPPYVVYVSCHACAQSSSSSAKIPPNSPPRRRAFAASSFIGTSA